MVQHDSGNGLFAYPRGRPGRDRLPPEKLPCPADVNSKMLKLRMDFGIGHSNKMMVFISLATKDMVRYMSMYPEVWFMDCTAGTYKRNFHCCNTLWFIKIKRIQFQYVSSQYIKSQ
jgi:hypothetical protein